MPVITRSQSRALARPTVRSPSPSPSPREKASHDSAKSHLGFWPCLSCSCCRASFEAPIGSCLTCGHTMDDHPPDINHFWNPVCDYICPRKALVTSVVEHVRMYGVVVIRATPMVGKSVLLKLIGHHIVHDELDLEPIFLNWKTQAKRRREEREDNYLDYLKAEGDGWQRRNTEIRPHNPKAKKIYLIDEAQDSYEQDDFWYMLKNHQVTRTSSLYVLVCVYGTDVLPAHNLANVESQARKMHSLQRIELRHTAPETPCMLFTRNELEGVFRRFLRQNGYTSEEEIVPYLYEITQGHPGMIGSLLFYAHLRLKVSCFNNILKFN